MMQEEIDTRSVLMRWAGLLTLSAVFVAALQLLHLPAALLLGPMLAAILFAACQKTVKVPTALMSVAQALVGCLVAKSVPITIVAEIGHDWPIFAAGVVSVILAALVLGYLLARLQVLPGTTAIWGSMPGGATAMIIMAAAFGADMRLVAFMQYLRIVCVAIAASTISRIWVAKTGTPPPVVWFPPIEWLPMAETAGLIAVCIGLSRLIKIPAGLFLLPMILGMVAQNLQIIEITLPPWLLAASYALIGWTVGIRFTREILVYAARALPRVIGSIVILIAICCAFAAVLVYGAGIDPLTAYLATSPGGADSVAIIATATHVDVPFVMSMQLVRMAVILSTGPFLARLVVKWSGLADAPRESASQLA